MKMFLVADHPARHFSTAGVSRRQTMNRRSPVAAVVGATHQPQPVVFGHRAIRRAGVDRANRIRPCHVIIAIVKLQNYLSVIVKPKRACAKMHLRRTVYIMSINTRPIAH